VNRAGPSHGTPTRSPQFLRAVKDEWPLVSVLAVCTAGVLVVLSEHFRRGTVLFAGGLVLAAGLRALLPGESAGLLVVRGRLVDVITLTALGLGVLLAALVVPPPS
jgi:hypothetical protein